MHLQALRLIVETNRIMLILVFFPVVPSASSVSAPLDARMYVMMHNLDSQRNRESGDEQIQEPAFATSYWHGDLAVGPICHTAKTNWWIISEIRVSFLRFGQKKMKVSQRN